MLLLRPPELTQRPLIGQTRQYVSQTLDAKGWTEEVLAHGHRTQPNDHQQYCRGPKRYQCGYGRSIGCSVW